MRLPLTLDPLSDDLIARLRAAASATSPGEARAWLPAPRPTTRLLRILARYLGAPSIGWYLHA